MDFVNYCIKFELLNSSDINFFVDCGMKMIEGILIAMTFAN